MGNGAAVLRRTKERLVPDHRRDIHADIVRVHRTLYTAREQAARIYKFQP